MMTDEELEKLTDEEIGYLRTHDQPSWWRAIEISEQKKRHREPSGPTSLEPMLLAMSTEQIHAMTVQDIASYSDWKIDRLSRKVLDKLEINREVYSFVAFPNRRRTIRKDLATEKVAAAGAFSLSTRPDILEEFKKYFATNEHTNELVKVLAEAIKENTEKVWNKVCDEIPEKMGKPLRKSITDAEARIEALELLEQKLAGTGTDVSLADLSRLEKRLVKLEGTATVESTRLSNLVTSLIRQNAKLEAQNSILEQRVAATESRGDKHLGHLKNLQKKIDKLIKIQMADGTWSDANSEEYSERP